MSIHNDMHHKYFVLTSVQNLHHVQEIMVYLALAIRNSYFVNTLYW